MTKDKSHRELFLALIFEDGKSLEAACRDTKISTRTGARWLEQYHATGSILPVRHRELTDGKMPYDDQEALFALAANNRTCHVDELTQLLLEDTGHNHSERLIRQIMFRQKYVYKIANHLAPLERDPELRRYWIEEVLGAAGFTSDQFLFVDESSKKLKDCRRPRVHAVKGDVFSTHSCV
jgi:transposase